MEKKLIISKMYKEIEDNYVRVCSNIYSDKPEYKMWFKIERVYEEYILLEKMDAFLIAVLPYAIKKELDIVIEGKISERLYYQLTTYLIPMLCKEFNKRIIVISAELENKRYNTDFAVGTGISCGIDSFYTISQHIGRKELQYNITHLTFFNAGASGEYGGEESRRLYEERMEFARKFADENKFKFLCVDTNMNEFLMMNHQKTHTFRSLACVLILQKLFSKYYYSSGVSFGDSKIVESDTAKYDILNLQCLSTEDVTFYSTGMEKNRIEKVEKITEYKPTYDFLNVCVTEKYNCGECEKCIRTLLELDSIGKLNLYKNVFDIDKFNKNRNKYYLFLLQKMKVNNHAYIEVYNEYKKRKIKIPLYIKIFSIFPNMEYCRYILFKIFPKEKLKKFLKMDKDPKRRHDGWLD